MFKVPLILTLSLLFVACFKLPATPLRVTEASIVRITGHKDDFNTGCTAFVIAPQKILTANHCIDGIENLAYDGKRGRILFADVYYDLALIQTNTKKEPLQLADTPVTEDQIVIAIGYAKNWTSLLVLREVVRLPNYAIMPEAPAGLIMQGGIIAGMSGGPIIDYDGKVVSICQRATEVIGYGVSADAIRTFLLDARGHGVF